MKRTKLATCLACLAALVDDAVYAQSTTQISGKILPLEVEYPYSVTKNKRYPVTLDYLYESCAIPGDPQLARGDIPSFDCESFVYGVLDSYLDIRMKMPPSERACFPPDLPPWRALEITEPVLRNLSSGGELAAPAIIRALRAKYPCS